MGTRILGYGSEYNVSVNDPETNEEVELQVDLTTLQPKELDEKLGTCRLTEAKMFICCKLSKFCNLGIRFWATSF